MVSVGLWGAQLGAPAVWLLPVTFPMVMAFGGMLGLMGVPLPGVEVGIALSGILLGLPCSPSGGRRLGGGGSGGLLRDVPRPRPRHGAAARRERPALQHRLRGRDGRLHAGGIGIGVIHRWGWGRVALRVAGAVVALAGGVFLWRAFA